jgi:hypothetical protein
MLALGPVLKESGQPIVKYLRLDILPQLCIYLQYRKHSLLHNGTYVYVCICKVNRAGPTCDSVKL